MSSTAIRAQTSEPGTPTPTSTQVMGATNTPATGTVESIWNTATPVGTRGVDCPNDLPVGWGTVTPDVWWDINCRVCIGRLTSTSTAIWPTFTPEGTITATPTLTYTPGTPTVTPTPTSTPVYTYFLSEEVAYDYLSIASGTTPVSHTFRLKAPIEVTWWYTDHNDMYVVGYVVIMSHNRSASEVYDYSLGGAQVGNYPGLSLTQQSQYSYTVKANVYLPFNDNNAIRSLLFPYSSTELYFGSVITYPMNYTVGWGHKLYSVVGLSAWGWDSIRYILYGQYIETPQGGTPTPSPTIPVGTSTPQSFCNSVNNTEGGGSTEGGFGLPVLTLGDRTCITLPELWLDLGILSFFGINWGTLHVPSISFCLRSISFGILQLFGLDVNLDLISVVMSVVLGIRLIRGH